MVKPEIVRRNAPTLRKRTYLRAYSNIVALKKPTLYIFEWLFVENYTTEKCYFLKSAPPTVVAVANIQTKWEIWRKYSIYAFSRFRPFYQIFPDFPNSIQFPHFFLQASLNFAPSTRTPLSFAANSPTRHPCTMGEQVLILDDVRHPYGVVEIVG